MSKTLDQFSGLPMFDPRSRNTDPETSHMAAASMKDEAAGQRKRILEALRLRGSMTADELDSSLGLRETSAGRRLPELREMGYVRRLEETRKTRSGRKARLWEAVP